MQTMQAPLPIFSPISLRKHPRKRTLSQASLQRDAYLSIVGEETVMTTRNLQRSWLNIRLQLVDQLLHAHSSIFPSCYDSFYGACFKSMLLSVVYTNVTGSRASNTWRYGYIFLFPLGTNYYSIFLREYGGACGLVWKRPPTPQGAILAGKAFVAYLIQAIPKFLPFLVLALIFGPTGNVGHYSSNPLHSLQFLLL